MGAPILDLLDPRGKARKVDFRGHPGEGLQLGLNFGLLTEGTSMHRHLGCCAVVLGLVFAAPAIADTTVTVSPAGLGPWQSVVSDSHGNFVTDTDATVSWGVNPPGAPAGTGSVTLDTGTNHGDSAPQLVDQAIAGTQLAAIKSLSYSTLGTLIAGPTLAGQLPYIVLTLDLNNDGVEDDSIVFEPLYQHGYRSDIPDQGAIQTGAWQRWDAAAGGWWSFSGTLAGASPGFGVKTLKEILAAAPDARIVAANTIPPAGLRVVIGVRNTPDHLVGSVDALSIDTGTGLTTYDFEPGTQPQEGNSIVVTRAAGTVLYQTSSGVQTLSTGKKINLGSFIDATHGQVTITSASDSHGSYQTALYYGGKFKTRQRGSKRPVTEAYLIGKIGPCNTKKGKKATAAAKKKRSRHLWGDAHGNFRTVGKASSAAERGTKWLVTDTCAGTTTKVVSGKVLVRKFSDNTKHIVTAGHSFFARRAGS
jgi:hypothetical protein